MVVAGDILDGKYRIVRQIGRGGFGRVYLGRDVALDRDVAIKVLNPELAEGDSTFLDRFTEEARHIARLDHHNIMPVYVHGTVGDTAYLIMPYIAGGSLHDWLTQQGRLSPQQAGDYLGQAAAALDYAHARNTIHRDVKPENMLLRDDGRLLLADFGLAKVVEETRLSSSRTLRGTPYYMAPEAWRGQSGQSADVYALGCVLFEMLAGKPPYTGSMEQLFAAHMQGPVPSLAERGGGPMPPALQSLIERALAKEPQDRYPSAGALALAVQRVVEGDVSAQADTVPAHTPLLVPKPPQRRRRVNAIVAGVVLALLLCVVGVVAYRRGGALPAATPTVGAVAANSTATPRPNPTVVPTATVVAVSAATRVPPTATAPPAAIWFSGDLRVGKNRGRDLDLLPPSDVSANSLDDDVTFWPFPDSLEIYGSAVPWTAAALPTSAQCADVLTRLGLGQPYTTFNNPQKGLSFCLTTTEGRVAFVIVTGITQDAILITVTVWEKLR